MIYFVFHIFFSFIFSIPIQPLGTISPSSIRLLELYYTGASKYVETEEKSTTATKPKRKKRKKKRKHIHMRTWIMFNHHIIRNVVRLSRFFKHPTNWIHCRNPKSRNNFCVLFVFISSILVHSIYLFIEILK